jgi:hypothetical protein
VRSTENICNPQEEGENLWWDRYRLALDDHRAKFDDFMKKTIAASPAAAAYSGPARTGPAGGGRGGRGARGGGPQTGGGAGRGGAAPDGAGRSAGAAPVAGTPGAPIVRPMEATDRAKLRTLGGAWRLSTLDAPLPNGLTNAGTLLDLPLTPEGQAAVKTHDAANDPAKFCQAIGPFRMLARAGNAFEILPTGQGAVMVFESTALGNKRDIIFGRDHLQDFEPNWLGDSIGRFEGDTLIVDTIGFNHRTWLNAAAAQHSPRLRMVERYRLVPKVNVLELKVTIEDPVMLKQPYTYTRYYQQSAELGEDFCVADIIK